MRTLRALLPVLVFAVVPALAQFAPPSITTTSPLPNGTLNQNYNFQLSCTNCTGYSYTLVSGSLPPSLSLSPSGIISGISNTVGTYTFQIGLLPAAGGPVQATKTFSLTVPSAVNILSTTFPAGSVGAAYSQTLSASGGVPPYTWSITQGALPPGLGIQNNNSIAGTPTAVGTYIFTLSVVDSQSHGAFAQTSITINAATSNGAAITTTTLPNGVVNVAYTTQLACINCANWVWSLTSGVLPLGLQLSAGGGITGTPTGAGTVSFQITLSPPPTFENAPPPSVSQIFTLTVNAAGLGIAQTSLPIAFTNTLYSTTLTGTGGLTPYSWSLGNSSTGNDGLTIGASSGTISGTPTASGTFILNVQLADSSGLTLSRQFTLSVSTGLTILTTTLPNGSVGTVYGTQTLTAGGGQPPYRWSVTTGTLPPGLTLDPAFGHISGTPTSNGKYPFTLTVTDNQSNTATANLSITVGAGVTITISPTTLTAGTVGTAYTATLTASGGTAPYTWSVVSGTLPTGLTLNATGGVSGTPTAAGNYSFTVQATDSTQATGQAAISLTIAVPTITISPATLPSATVGVAYTQALTASGGASPYKFAVTAGSLPSGFSLSAAGSITGTATAVESGSFTVTATDSNGATGTAQYTLTVKAATVTITIAPATLPAATVGVAYTPVVLTASGGASPYKFAVTAGSLPSGFALSAAGSLTGTATAAGPGSFTVTATDSNGATGTIQYTLTVNAAAPTITIAPATLPAATAGTAYSQALTATGGAAPYKFAVTAGSLPSGFSLSATGTITGTATAAESGTFTVTATDSNGATGTIQYSLTATAPSAPTVTLAGLPASPGFEQQPSVTPTLSSTYPVPVTGTVTLTFTPSVTPPAGSTGTIDDAMIQFSGGGRTATFTIPAGSTTASNLTVLTGTTAGTITLTTTLSANGGTLGSPTTQIIVNPAGVPFISKVTLQQVAGGVTVVITGFSSTRDMTNASFAFAPATGDTFTSNNVSVPVQTAFSTWWANTAQSNPFGTQFTLTVPFTLATATQSVTSVAVVSVTVTLQNSKGASNSVTLSQ